MTNNRRTDRPPDHEDGLYEGPKFRGLLEAAPDGIVIVDLEGRIVLTNARLEAMFDYPRKELLGQPVDRLIPLCLFGQPFQNRHEPFSKPGNRPMQMGTALIGYRRDGTEFPIEISLSPMGDGDRGGELVIGIIRDVTENRRAARELWESREQLQAIMNNTSSVIFAKDTKGRYFLINKRFENIFHITLGEILGKTDWDLFPAEQAKVFTENDRKVLESGTFLEMEEEVSQEDGIHAYISAKFPLRDPSGHPYAVCGIATDITERKRAEGSVRASERRWRTLLENVRLVVVGLNREGCIDYVNPFFSELTGYSCEEVEGWNWFNRFIPPRLRREVRSGFDQMFGKDSLSYYQNPILTRAGEERIIEWFNTRLEDPAGGIVGTLSIGGDITDRQRAEDELRRQKALLEKKCREMDDFIHVVSHDLKEPLRGIEAFSGFIEEDYGHLLDAEGKRYLAFLKGSAVRMKNLIHDLLALASITRRSPVLREVDLNRVLTESRQYLDFSIREKKVRIKIKKPLPVVMGDATHIGEVFKNLLSNAMKFNRSVPPRVEIASEPLGGHHLISIKDNGIGIEPSYADRIFRLFERLHREEEFSGTGAGLAICKEVIEGYGGKIWVESQPGEGSVFYFTLPAASERSADSIKSVVKDSTEGDPSQQRERRKGRC